MESRRFEIYRTENVFTSLLLDTRTGRLWQIAYSLDNKHFEGRIPVSADDKASETGKNGRFSLTSTFNMWTFFLTDNITGAVWHCQFSIKDSAASGCKEIAASIAD